MAISVLCKRDLLSNVIISTETKLVYSRGDGDLIDF